MTLDLESNGFALLIPHGRGHILLGVDDLVISLINVEARLLHLNTKFAHHLGRLGLVLVCLHLSLDFVGVEVSRLISLRECMMISDTISIVSETSEVWLGSLLFFNSDSHNFNLIIS